MPGEFGVSKTFNVQTDSFDVCTVIDVKYKSILDFEFSLDSYGPKVVIGVITNQTEHSNNFRDLFNLIVH